MSVETNMHRVKEVKIEIRPYGGFSALKVMATDSNGQRASFVLFSEGESFTVPTITVFHKEPDQ